MTHVRCLEQSRTPLALDRHLQSVRRARSVVGLPNAIRHRIGADLGPRAIQARQPPEVPQASLVSKIVLGQQLELCPYWAR